MENAGRWSLLHPIGEPWVESPSRDAVETVAWTLLRRYGVVSRKLLERETLLPPWRDLLTALRRLEAQGEIRGGRFVDGFSGEQYALTEAVGQLRALPQAAQGTLVSVSGRRPPEPGGHRAPWRPSPRPRSLSSRLAPCLPGEDACSLVPGLKDLGSRATPHPAISSHRTRAGIMEGLIL
jgi:hypothetical protein